MKKACGGDKKKARKPNYRMEELEVLVEDVVVNKQLLLGKFSDTTTNERKKKVWKNISAKMRQWETQKDALMMFEKNGRTGRAKLKGKNTGSSGTIELQGVDLKRHLN